MKSEILDKIKKLLRMKSGGTAAEVETALNLAKKLADKYNIDLTAVNENQHREPITHSNLKTLSRLQIENKYSALIIKSFFNVNVIISTDFTGKRIVFVGRESDIEIAKYTYEFLVRHFRNEWRTKRGRLKNRQSFMKGLYIGLYDKLIRSEHSQIQTEGIVLVNNSHERDKYLENQFGKLEQNKVEPDRESKAALNRGFKSGIETNLHKGISKPQTNKMLR